MKMIPFPTFRSKEPINDYDYNLIKHPVPSKKPAVTVITPIYNNEKTIRNCIDSVLTQTLGHENIEYILVDDGSIDNSRSILLEYANKHPMIMLAFLKRNSGTPASPRNLGIQLATAPYITFLDADDWLEKTGLEKLYTVLEETGDDYVVGKTIQKGSKLTKIIGEHESCMERRSVSPASIPHIFQHLGPRARMMKTKIIKENNLRFPAMKFAEDKQFFMDYLLASKKISTIKDTVYYVNRLDDNNKSLTKQTNVLKKMKCNLQVIDYFQQKELDETLQKMLLNRLYEFDCFIRFINKYHTLRRENRSSLKTKTTDFMKRQSYIWTFKKVLKTTKKLDYDITDHFFQPINKVCYELFKNKQYKQLEELFKWHTTEKVKQHIVKDNQPYMVSPLQDPYKYIEIPMYAEIIKSYVDKDHYVLEFKVSGKDLADITDILFRDRANINNEFSVKTVVDRNGFGKLELPVLWFASLPKTVYNIFLRYQDYNKIYFTIPDSKVRVSINDSNASHFYTTKHQHLALKIQ
ncbi:glycosyltransferase family 2 protein [Niallia sp. 01092]|uniref:glycosyltransferase family 2 protein n=1 Tax=unclassified Niallia TaxID=2837522 RepID=UPI003FD03821